MASHSVGGFGAPTGVRGSLVDGGGGGNGLLPCCSWIDCCLAAPRFFPLAEEEMDCCHDANGFLPAGELEIDCLCATSGYNSVVVV